MNFSNLEEFLLDDNNLDTNITECLDLWYSLSYIPNLKKLSLARNKLKEINYTSDKGF